MAGHWQIGGGVPPINSLSENRTPNNSKYDVNFPLDIGKVAVYNENVLGFRNSIGQQKHHSIAQMLEFHAGHLASGIYTYWASAFAHVC